MAVLCVTLLIVTLDTTVLNVTLAFAARAGSRCLPGLRCGSTRPTIRCRTCGFSAIHGSPRRSSSVDMLAFGLFGTLFVLTQYLQFCLGYTAL